MRFFFSIIGFALFIALLAPVSAQENKVDRDAEEKPKSRPSFGSSSRGTARSVYLTPSLQTANEKRILSAILWQVDDTKPLTRMEINLTQQKVYGYQGDRLVAISPISSGLEGRRTPVGNYKVIQKSKDHKSNLYGSFVNAQGVVINADAKAGQKPPAGATYVPSPMKHFLRLTHSGIGLHAGYLPGYAASHGCIRLPASFAEDLFPVVPMGTPVEIIP